MDKIKNRFSNMVFFYVRHGLRPLSNILLFVNPLICLLVFNSTGRFSNAIVFMVAILLVSILLDIIAEILNVGKEIPIPYKRFTNDDEVDGVTVNKSDLNDMILFMNDYENWIERSGFVDYRKHQNDVR